MAEVTKEMILEYMQAKNGVVKNVDLVRHFRKHLQQSDARARDLARNQFKARVDEVAFIKADEKGEKYLYLKGEPAHSSAVTNRNSTSHSVISKRESVSSTHSSGEGYSSVPPTSTRYRSPTRGSPGHTTGGSPGHSTRSSVSANFNNSSSVHSPSREPSLSSRAPSEQPTPSSAKEPSFSLLGDSFFSDSALSSFFEKGASGTTSSHSGTGGATGTTSSHSGTGGASGTTSSHSGTGGASGTTSSHSGTQARETTTSTSSRSGPSGRDCGPAATTTSSRSGPSARDSGPATTTTSSRSGTSARESGPATTTTSSRGGTPGRETTTAGLTATPTTRSVATTEPSTEVGEESSFATDILNSFFGTTSSSNNSGVSGVRDFSITAHNTASPSASSAGRSTSQHTSNKATRSEVPGAKSSGVTLRSYKPITSPPIASTRSPSPPPSSHTSTRLSPPPHQPAPAKPSPSPPQPPPRNPSYTATYSNTTSGSVFSPPPPQTSPTGEDLFAQVTSGLSSFGELGSLMDSIMATEPTTTSNTVTSDPPSKTAATSDSLNRSSKLGANSFGSSSQTSGSVVPPSSSSSSSTQQRGSPAKSSSATSTFTRVHSPPGAPGSPMRVPRMNGGLHGEPSAPPSSSTHSNHTWHNGPVDDHLSQDGFPQISIQRVDSPRSDTSSNGVTSPPHHTATAAAVSGLDTRPRLPGLPPLPPSATDPRRISAATANGGLGGVALRPQDRASRERALSSASARRSRNLDTRTSAAIMGTPPSIRRQMQAAPSGGGMYARPAPGSREDLSQYHSDGGDQDGSLSAPSEDYEVDPLEKDWMLACASADMQEINTLMIRDATLINRRDFLHGTALHWAAKQGRCDIMSILILNGAFPNIKSNGGFTPLHLACQGGYDNAIAMLVRDHGANVNARDNSGRKPVDMLDYSCSESIRALLTHRLTGSRIVHHSSEQLPSFSQPRTRIGSLSNTWASMPNSLESSDEKKKRISPKMNKRTFSFRLRHKVNSPHDKKERPRSHIPETYDA